MFKQFYGCPIFLPVAGFEQQAKNFIEKMATLGVNITKTTDVMVD